MTIYELLELAREEPDHYEDYMQEATIEDLRDMVISWDNENYMDFSRSELLDTVMDLNKEGAKGRDYFTRDELIADIRDMITTELDE